jgi:hypothetical protein
LEDADPLPSKLEIRGESNLLLLFHQFQVIHDFQYSYSHHFLYYGHWAVGGVRVEASNSRIVRKLGYPSTELVSGAGKDSAVHIHHRWGEENSH